MKYTTVVLSFIVVFILVFVLGGLFLMPHILSTPDRTITALENEFWTRNWAGAVLGLILGGLSTWSAMKKKPESAEASK
ncbi:MAG: hypothetical protein JEZ07_15775 [Phycisphaerae bacterium]|nr:hypothetical protein [Phycisphaerae bacterium]